MKKVYINPESEVIKVQTQQMLAASLGYGDPTDTVDSPGLVFDKDTNMFGF